MKRDKLKNAWDATNPENPSRQDNYSDKICNVPKSNI